MKLSNRKEVKNWLDSMGIENYTIKEDLTVNVAGDVNLSEKSLKKMPVRFGIVSGVFNCARNQLKSLKGVPHTVRELDCNLNQIKNLKHLPQTVTDLNLGNNRLTSLKGSPLKCGLFTVSGNKLKSLKHAPQEVHEFNCASTGLKSLKYAPRKAVRFYCYRNQLTTLEYLPSGLEILNCSYNLLKDLSHVSGEINTLFCDENQIESLEKAPRKITRTLNIEKNKVVLNDLHKYDIELNCIYLTVQEHDEDLKKMYPEKLGESVGLYKKEIEAFRLNKKLGALLPEKNQKEKRAKI